MAVSERGRRWMLAMVLASAPVIWFGIIRGQMRRSVRDTAITVSVPAELVKDGVTLQWQGMRADDTRETVSLHPGQQAIRGYYAWSAVELYCPQVSGGQRFILSSAAPRREHLDSRVTCTGTIDQFACVLEAGGEKTVTSGTCYPPDGPELVSVEPLDGEVEGMARLQVVAHASHSLKGRLELAGRPYENPVHAVSSPLGMLLHAVSAKNVPASARALTVINVGRLKVLVSLQQGSVLAIRDDGCAPWELDASWLNAGAAGQFRVRAVTGTAFTVEEENGPPTQGVVPPSGLTRYYPFVYRHCGRDGIATASDRAMFAIGAGERWTINLRADGRILGGVRDP